PAHCHRAADICRDRGHVAGGDAEETAELSDGARKLGTLHEGYAVLRDDDAARCEPRLGRAVESLAEQHFAGADGVGRIDDNDIVALARLLDELRAVGKNEIETRI